MRRLLKLLRSEHGQGMSEYLIIVALVAIAAIGVVTVFGRDVRELFSGTTDSLAGNQATNTAATRQRGASPAGPPTRAPPPARAGARRRTARRSACSSLR